MFKRWLFYLTALIGCFVLWIAQQTWHARLVFLCVFCLPWLSLGLSIGAMVLVRPSFDFPPAIPVGTPQKLGLNVRCKLPLPPYRVKISLLHTLTGRAVAFKPGQEMPCGHCGALVAYCTKFYIYDYLGLFRIRSKRLQPKQMIVRPQPVPVDTDKSLQRAISLAWRPKAGGGFAENHELRLFRPGDSLNQVHWKLTAKTGKLTIREPMIPVLGRLIVSVEIRGDATSLDRKFGQLLYLGQQLLDAGLPFQIHALTGDGPQTFPVCSQRELQATLDRLLCTSPAPHDAQYTRELRATWHYHIGGDADES